jgi:hypothetical protein
MVRKTWFLQQFSVTTNTETGSNKVDTAIYCSSFWAKENIQLEILHSQSTQFYLSVGKIGVEYI